MQTRKAPPGRTSILHEGIVKPFGPHQRTRRSASVQALKTRRGGASKTRVMTSSGFAVSAAGVVFSATFPPPPLPLPPIYIQPIQTLLPQTAVVLHPHAGGP